HDPVQRNELRHHELCHYQCLPSLDAGPAPALHLLHERAGPVSTARPKKVQEPRRDSRGDNPKRAITVRFGLSRLGISAAATTISPPTSRPGVPARPRASPVADSVAVALRPRDQHRFEDHPTMLDKSFIRHNPD